MTPSIRWHRQTFCSDANDPRKTAGLLNETKTLNLLGDLSESRRNVTICNPDGTPMTVPSSKLPIRIAIVGVGAVSDYHHVPAIRLDPRATLAAACDSDWQLLEERGKQWGLEFLSADYNEICESEKVDAVVIATPNFTHRPIALAAVRHGKHVMCEKPLGLNAGEVREMYQAARDAGVVHMTAFTYRFAPSMRYMRDLARKGELGELRHFRSQRFLDLPETSWGWRQYQRKAGAGDLFDMTIHRIDFAIDLLGPLERICGSVARFARRDHTASGQKCPPSEVDDWSALIGHFSSGAVGVWEGTTLAKGYGLSGFGHEWAEINGSQQSAVYRLHEPNKLWLGRTGTDLSPVDVPSEYLVPAGSPRDANEGVPATVFRYDLMWEFVSAIVQRREAVPSFYDGLRAQLVADAVLQSHQHRVWVEIPDEPR
jgi:predicted dehydrogenase